MPSTGLWNDPARAWEPYVPGPDAPWDLPRVAHLHRRAGFAASWGVLQRDLKEGPDASLARLLEGEPLALDGRPASEFEALADAMARQLAPGASLARLQSLWLYRMIFTGHPLRERMTLFWHSHFATSELKVRNPELMQRQNRLLREHALGSFPTLLGAIGKDPAMLIWLDSTANRKAHPNENYAREVMELFTLGRGNYTEADIREAARAFTGWFVVNDRFHEVAAQHDGGVKTVLGRTGTFDGDEIPAILLAQPACAEFLCRKLVRAFVSEVDAPSRDLVAPLAETYRSSGYDTRAVVARILHSRLFFDPAVRRRRVKSPVEYAVGTIRALEITHPTVGVEALAETCGRMGQNLYAPPSVAGWDGGPAWISAAALLARASLAQALTSETAGALGGRCKPLEFAREHGFTGHSEVARFFRDLLVQDAFEAPVETAIAEAAGGPTTPAVAARRGLAMVLTAPEYQLA